MKEQREHLTRVGPHPSAAGERAGTPEREAPSERLLRLLAELSETPAPSGHERKLARRVAAELEAHADAVRTDALGNVIAKRSGSGTDTPPRLMIAAHMDEIGLIVTKIEDEGFLRFAPVGGIDPRTLAAQEVTVLSEPPLHGFIGVKPPHLLPEEERDKTVPVEDMFIDVGLSGDEARRRLHPGDVAVVKRAFTRLQGTRAAGKALDNRAGVVAMLEAMHLLSGLRHAADVYAVATVQEEVGLRGAMVSAYGIVPDAAIAVDVGFGAAPGLPEDDVIRMGKGPAIALGPNVHPRLHELLVETARLHGIPHQIEPMPAGSGTDAWAMQVVRSGVPTAVVSVPLRYMHSSVEVVDIEDVRNTARLLAHAAAALSEEDVKGWTYDLA